MSDTQTIPSLDDVQRIVTARYEGIYTTGNPHELELLSTMLDRISAHAQREERLARLAVQATPEDGSAA